MFANFQYIILVLNINTQGAEILQTGIIQIWIFLVILLTYFGFSYGEFQATKFNQGMVILYYGILLDVAVNYIWVVVNEEILTKEGRWRPCHKPFGVLGGKLHGGGG